MATLVAQWGAACDHRPLPGNGRDIERAADRADPVGHVQQTCVALPLPADFKPGTVVTHLEVQRAVFFPDPDLHLALASRVLGRILKGLHARKVDGGLYGLGIAADAAPRYLHVERAEPAC